MIVLDTNAFIWWRTASRHLSADARRAIENADRIGVPDMVLWEVARLIHLGRVRISVAPRTWLEAAIAEQRIDVLPVTPEIAVASAALQQELSRDPVDSIVAATAMRLGVPLVTSDSTLHGVALIETIW